MSLPIQNYLELFDMPLTTNHSNGLVEVLYNENGKLNFNAYDETKVSPKELFALEKASEYKASFVYFRKFSNRPSIPQIYIYDYTSQTAPNKDEIADLHKKLYSAVVVPMFFVFTSLEVNIFNCFEQPAKGGEVIYKPLETIKIASDLLEAVKNTKSKEYKKIKGFSGKLFDNGSFWENSVYSKQFSIKNSAYEKLLGELKNALNKLTTKLELSKTITRKLLVMGILIKYLEERTDDRQHSVFPKKGERRIKRDKDGIRKKSTYEDNFFEEFAPNAETFVDVLKAERGNALKHPVLKLFEYLGGHFNGEFFKFTEEEKEKVEQLSDYTFQYLGAFFNGELEGNQYVIWKLYSFKDLPIELISNIYEAFLEKKAGVVYTPPFLVELLLDESMPIADTKTDLKILDPACGSGIFLVGAYKRLIQRWRYKNNWKPIKLDTLKRLLKNIYGVDINGEAVRLSIFSLNIALCDELSPIEIWEELIFDSLHNKQIYSEDFFQLLLDRKSDDNLKKEFSEFDLVIGNPPFVSNLSEAAKTIEKETSQNRLLEINGKEIKVDLPDKQIALSFLEQSIQLCKENGWATLIMPAGPLLYNKTAFNFRNTILSTYHVPQIFDFTALRSSLFSKANVAAATIFIQKKAVERQGIYHITFRSIKQNKEKIHFELDNYDFHYTPRKQYLGNHNIWKYNFWGGGRIAHLMEYLNELKPTLREYVDNQGWTMAEGFSAATSTQVENLGKLQNNRSSLSDKDLEKLERLEKKYRADFLTGKNTVDYKYFTENGIDEQKGINILETQYFYRKSENSREIFKPPHILIREILGRQSLILEYREDYLSFTNQIIGIHAPNYETQKLRNLETYLKDNSTLLFYATASSSRTLLREGSLYLVDIENLPYPENKSSLELNDIENVIIEDFLEYLLPFRIRQKSKALNDTKKIDLKNFATYYCKVLNSVYKNLKPHDNYLETDSFICTAFYFGEEKPTIDFGNKEEAEKYLENLVYNNSNQHLKITRVVRIYDKNVIYLIKPKQVRYWLRSVAVRDADDTFADLRNQGY